MIMEEFNDSMEEAKTTHTEAQETGKVPEYYFFENYRKRNAYLWILLQQQLTRIETIKTLGLSDV
jgi:hypothetical protein